MTDLIRRCLVVGCCLVLCVAAVRGKPVETLDLLTPEVVKHADTSDGLRLERSPDGVEIVFDDAGHESAQVTFRLPEVMPAFEPFDELWFELKLEHGVVEPDVTLWGYPDAHRCRRWFFKQEPVIGAWTTVRYELDLDDDRSLKTSTSARRELHLRFRRPATQPVATGATPTARVRAVRLVRRPFSVDFDPRAGRFDTSGDGVRVTHPVTLANHTGESLECSLDIESDTLGRFQPVDLPRSITLAPNATREVPVVLRASGTMDAGTVERARLVVSSPQTPGYTATPLRGYRPRYLYGMQPLHVSQPEGMAPEPEESPSQSDLQTARAWRFNIPTDITPRYEDHFRCKTCGFRLRARDPYHYFCHNDECERHDQVFAVERGDPLLASYLSVYHKQSAATAATLARAGDDATAGRILTTYADHYGQLPMPSPHSTGFHCRLSSATLFEKDALSDFTDAFVLLHAQGELSEADAKQISTQLLTPSLHNVNLHAYGATAGQVGFLLAQIKAAVATERWWFLADSLAGDASVQSVLDRTFDRDGIGVEGGAYATSAAERVIKLGQLLDTLGIAVNRERIAQIQRNSRAIGLLPGAPADETLVLEHTGYTALVSGAGNAWRRATINWGSSRERGEHDLMSFDFADRQGPLVTTTGRIAYGNKQSKFMLRTLAHNVPVINFRDVSQRRFAQRYVHGGDAWVGCIVSDPAAADRRSHVTRDRALVLVHGVLLVVDRITADQPVTIDLPLYGLDQIEVNVSRSPVSEAVGPTDAYEVISQWQRGNTPVSTLRAQSGHDDKSPVISMHYSGPDATVYTGQSITGWTARPRDFLMLRRHANQWQAGVAYSSLRGAGDQLEALEALTNSGEATAAYRLTFHRGEPVTVRVSFGDAPAIEVAGQP